MKKKVLFILFFCFLFNSFSQEEEKVLPISWGIDLNRTVSLIELPPIDLEGIAIEDSINDLDKSMPWRYGLERPLILNLNEEGVWTELADGSKLWQIAIKSPEALNLSVNFNDFHLPEGARLHLYSEDRTDLSKTYTKDNNRINNKLGSWFITGDVILVEYYEPKEISGTVQLEIGGIIHGYRMGNVNRYVENIRGLNDSGDCNFDVNCSVGDDFEPKKDILKKAVALLNLGNGYLCSASLLNNTSSDKTPYLLTANHCLEYSDPSFWVIRFNWMSPNPICSGEEESLDIESNFTMSGADLRASNPLSDFALVEMFNSIPNAWDVTFAGWDHSGTLPEFEVGIHHPNGDIMKICRDDSGAVKENANGTEVWLVGGVSVGQGDGWELGTTESGSSGSPLFNEEGSIIGQLYAGLSNCTGFQNNNDYDIYGRFGVSWNSGTSSDTRLIDWLDPINSGEMSIGSMQNSLSIPDLELTGQLDIYPNPASTTITIMNTRYPHLTYEIFNILGQEVIKGDLYNTYNVINVEELPIGIYLLHLIDSGSNADITKKIVIE
ncbi:MAG: lysyl endopeptidase [Flavobacteriaceae bacterium]